MVIVLLGLAASALMTLSGRLAVRSAEAMRARQALAVADALLAEIRHMPFTYCDPDDDANALGANRAALVSGGCATVVDKMGPEGAESRYNLAKRFDGVTDYQGFAMPGPGCLAGLCNLAGTVINGPGSSLAGCEAQVSLAPQALAGPLPIPAFDADGQPQVLRISVSVSCPGMQPLVVEGLAIRHAPNWF